MCNTIEYLKVLQSAYAYYDLKGVSLCFVWVLCCGTFSSTPRKFGYDFLNGRSLALGFYVNVIELMGVSCFLNSYNLFQQIY